MSDAVSKARTSQASALAAVKEQCSALDREKSSLVDEVDNLKGQLRGSERERSAAQEQLAKLSDSIMDVKRSLQLPQKPAMRCERESKPHNVPTRKA